MESPCPAGEAVRLHVEPSGESAGIAVLTLGPRVLEAAARSISHWVDAEDWHFTKGVGESNYDPHGAGR